MKLLHLWMLSWLNPVLHISKHRSNIQHTALKEAPAAAPHYGQSSEQMQSNIINQMEQLIHMRKNFPVTVQPCGMNLKSLIPESV